MHWKNVRTYILWDTLFILQIGNTSGAPEIIWKPCGGLRPNVFLRWVLIVTLYRVLISRRSLIWQPWLYSSLSKCVIMCGFTEKNVLLNFLFWPCKTTNESWFYLKKKIKKEMHLGTGVWFLSQKQTQQNPQEKLVIVRFLLGSVIPITLVLHEGMFTWHSWYLPTSGTTHTEEIKSFQEPLTSFHFSV